MKEFDAPQGPLSAVMSVIVLCDAGKLIWGMLASGLFFGLTSMIGLDMWFVFHKPRCEHQPVSLAALLRVPI